MYPLDDLDRAIINQLQGGFPIADEPFTIAAQELGIDADLLKSRIQNLLQENIVTRFGPMYQIEKIGGAFTLAAMSIPNDQFDQVAAQVNALREVAHNYRRDHEFNMWFVLATETPDGIAAAIERIETVTGYKVFNLPKEKEYFVGARFTA